MGTWRPAQASLRPRQGKLKKKRGREEEKGAELLVPVVPLQ